MHIDDWLDMPPKDKQEAAIKEWFEAFRMPAAERWRGRHPSGVKWQEWLDSHVVTCTYDGRKMRCVGASRLGDVWLTPNMNSKAYQVRPEVDDCKNWRIAPIKGVHA